MSCEAVEGIAAEAGDAPPIVAEENDEDAVVPEEEEDEPVFVRQYEIVKSILSYLCLRDLEAAAQTCSVWADVARLVKASRLFTPRLVVAHRYPTGETRSVVSYFNNRLSVTAETRKMIGSFRLSKRETMKQTLDSFKPCFNSAFKAQFNEPADLVLVATDILLNFRKRLDNSRKFVLHIHVA